LKLSSLNDKGIFDIDRDSAPCYISNLFLERGDISVSVFIVAQRGAYCSITDGFPTLFLSVESTLTHTLICSSFIDDAFRNNKAWITIVPFEAYTHTLGCKPRKSGEDNSV
jgi:hypothetical protein